MTWTPADYKAWVNDMDATQQNYLAENWNQLQQPRLSFPVEYDPTLSRRYHILQHPVRPVRVKKLLRRRDPKAWYFFGRPMSGVIRLGGSPPGRHHLDCQDGHSDLNPKFTPVHGTADHPWVLSSGDENDNPR